MFMFNRYQDMIERHKTNDLSESQPTKGNIAGGLTTIEEKALGNIQKIGRECRVDGVLDKAQRPTHPGLWFMDSSSAAAEMVTLCAAAGFVVHFFPTARETSSATPSSRTSRSARIRARYAPWPNTSTSTSRVCCAAR